MSVLKMYIQMRFYSQSNTKNREMLLEISPECILQCRDGDEWLSVFTWPSRRLRRLLTVYFSCYCVAGYLWSVCCNVLSRPLSWSRPGVLNAGGFQAWGAQLYIYLCFSLVSCYREGEKKKNSGTFLPWDFHLRASVYLERVVEDNLKKKKTTQNLKFLSCWLQNERSFPFLIGTDFFHICEDMHARICV